MATYTTDQLQGAGSAGVSLNIYPYVFTCINPGDSSYFFLDSNRDSNGTYNTIGSGGSEAWGYPEASGSWVDNQVGGLVTDGKYTMGCVVPPGTSSVVFTPATQMTGPRYKFRGTGTFSLETFTPRGMFSAAEKGAWFDASDLTTLFQDSAGTIPVTAVGQKVGKWLDKSGNNNHAVQATVANQPTYQIDSEGNPNVTFTKSGTQLVSPSIDFTATAQMSVFVGINVLDSSSAGVALELGADVNSVNGSFLVGAPGSSTDHSLYLRGTSTIRAAINNVSDGDDIITGLFDISQATKELELIPRLNFTQLTGSQITWTGTTAGTGNFGNLPLYIGSRSGLGTPYGGKIYTILVRGASTTSLQVYQTEAYTDSRQD
jgi:hypothetical protein